MFERLKSVVFNHDVLLTRIRSVERFEGSRIEGKLEVRKGECPHELKILYADDSPQVAQRVLQGVISRSLEKNLPGVQPDPERRSMEMVEPASLPESTEGPSRPEMVSAGAGLGVVFYFGWLALRRARARRRLQ